MLLVAQGSASSPDWQPVEVRSWAEVETPQGWNLFPGKCESENPDNAEITAYSPDGNTRLIFFLNYNQNWMTIDDVRAFQSRYMSALGFRICQTKDPILTQIENGTSYRQTYVRGTEDGAVIGTLVYPGWGQAHYTLIMEGQPAVADYYETIPPLMEEHIRPVFNKTEPGT